MLLATASQLLLCLFDGDTKPNGHERSLKANRALWFEQRVEDNPCLALLEGMESVLASVATSDAQLALVKVRKESPHEPAHALVDVELLARSD